MAAIVAPDPCQKVKIGGTMAGMRKTFIVLTALLTASASSLLGQASANIAAGRTQPSPLAPSEIVANAPKADWTAIAASDLLVMDLSPDPEGKPRRVVIQLMPPPFSAGWIGNIRTLAKAHWWDGTAINRVQDNYVVQWGDPDADDKAKAKGLPAGLVTVPESEYVRNVKVKPYVVAGIVEYEREFEITPLRQADQALEIDPYMRIGGYPGFFLGFPMGSDGYGDGNTIWPVHCYGMVGVGHDLSPNTGTGAELYVVIGHAPRHLDRNIALVGRVIEGIEHLSSLPRGHGALGFYDLAQGDERTGIMSIRVGTEVPGLPAYEYLSTESQSFAAYADARANRRDAFFIRPAGGADVCNIPVPVRRTT